jgi:flagellar protein FliT
MSALQAYEDALELTERMLTCARSAQWDQLVELEKERGMILEGIGRGNAQAGRSGADRDGKRRILQRMISCDQEIAALTQDWMAELRQILNSADTRNKLERTYSAR